MNLHAPGALDSLQLGRVTDNADPDNRGRVKVRLFATPMEIWAPVVAPSAGSNYGVSLLPRTDEIVVVAFVSPDLPLVLGSLWSGNSTRPQEADPQQDHYVVRSPDGTVMDFHDGTNPKWSVTTRSGYKITVDEAGGGTVQIECGAQSVKLGPSGIDITSSGTVKLDASTVTVNASTVTVNASMSRFSGVVQADTVIATSVVGTSYTPGAGNIW
jgi:uncharacterized protein involved in type VI secretion and phage assembly